MKKIYLYGTGKGALEFFDKNKENYEVMGFLDSNKEKKRHTFCEMPIYLPEEIINTQYDKIIIANEYYETYKTLLVLGVPFFKIEIIYLKCALDAIEFTAKNILKDAKRSTHELDYIYTMKMAHQIERSLELTYRLDMDYVRYKTLELLAQEINSNNIIGNVAEVGVFRGDFSKIINQVFPDRKLYLFDTFEGFDEKEIEFEIENNLSNKEFLNILDFKNTTIDIVMEKMLYQANCIIKKGYFPDTAKNLDEIFALVSIDVDLYMPIYNALEYFYERVASGGYIMIHDYNHKEFLGARKAIATFEAKYGKIKKVPLPDQGGTIVLIK